MFIVMGKIIKSEDMNFNIANFMVYDHNLLFDFVTTSSFTKQCTVLRISVLCVCSKKRIISQLFAVRDSKLLRVNILNSLQSYLIFYTMNMCFFLCAFSICHQTLQRYITVYPAAV